MNRVPTSTLDAFDRLYTRWQAERAYEPFADYVAAMQKHLPPGATFVSMTQRPFKLEFRTPTGVVWFVRAARTATIAGYYQ